MSRFAILFLVAACGGAGLGVASESDLATPIGAQSLTHGSGRQTFTFHGTAGDVIAPDAWPVRSLTLHGPDRALLAAASPRSARHLAIDSFKLPKTGTYLLTVSSGERFSLRLWMQSCHLPRQEDRQAELVLTPGPAAVAVLQDHARAPHRWTDAEIDRVSAEIQYEPDVRVAISSAQNLLSALRWSQYATDAQRAHAWSAAAARVGAPARFLALDPQVQAFTLWWLGGADALLFSSAPIRPPSSVDETVARLIAAWPGAHEQPGERRVRAKLLNGAIYGWQADWTAAVEDTDGTPVWIDFATEWFDSRGNWLAELSAGAGEPDDDEGR